MANTYFYIAAEDPHSAYYNPKWTEEKKQRVGLL